MNWYQNLTTTLEQQEVRNFPGVSICTVTKRSRSWTYTCASSLVCTSPLAVTAVVGGPGSPQSLHFSFAKSFFSQHVQWCSGVDPEISLLWRLWSGPWRCPGFNKRAKRSFIRMFELVHIFRQVPCLKVSSLSSNLGVHGLRSWGSHFWMTPRDGLFLAQFFMACHVPLENWTVRFDPNFPFSKIDFLGWESWDTQPNWKDSFSKATGPFPPLFFDFLLGCPSASTCQNWHVSHMCILSQTCNWDTQGGCQKLHDGYVHFSVTKFRHGIPPVVREGLSPLRPELFEGIFPSVCALAFGARENDCPSDRVCFQTRDHDGNYATLLTNTVQLVSTESILLPRPFSAGISLAANRAWSHLVSESWTSSFCKRFLNGSDRPCTASYASVARQCS